MQKLEGAAKRYPQEVHQVLTKSLQSEWTFLQRVVPDLGERCAPIKEAITQHFLPHMFSLAAPLTAGETQAMLRPAKWGGLGIRDPGKTAEAGFQTAKEATAHLAGAIRKGEGFDLPAHQMHAKETAERGYQREQDRHEREVQRQIADPTQPETLRRKLERVTTHNCSGWLSCSPREGAHTHMRPQEFRDACTLRYRSEVGGLGGECDGYAKKMSTEHALNCHKRSSWTSGTTR